MEKGVPPLAWMVFLTFICILEAVLVSASTNTEYAAIGLFDASSDSSIARVSGFVEKDGKSPLLVQDKPWEPRLDNAYPNIMVNGDGVLEMFYGMGLSLCTVVTSTSK